MGRDELAREGRPDLSSWVGRIGSFAWRPWSDLGATPPASWAAHAHGAIAFDDPLRGPAQAPFPGVAQMSTPFAWLDSLHAAPDGDAGWDGYSSTLARLAVRRDRPPGGVARTAFGLLGGSLGLDEGVLAVERGDSTQWLRIEAANGRRGAAGNLEDAGRHQWGGAGGLIRGPHRWEGAWTQRGAAMRLGGGDQQAVTGESGWFGYRHQRRTWSAAADYERGWTRHESFGTAWVPSYREAEEDRGSLGAALHRGRARWDTRFVYASSRVDRFNAGAFARSAIETWGAVRGALPAGDGTLVMSVGAGRHSGVDRTEWAPALQYAFADDRVTGRLVLERVLVPAWADLDPGTSGTPQAAFLQNTWRAGADVGLRADHGRATLGFHVGRTDDRAVVRRAAFEEQWLRAGMRADPDRYDFGLLTLDAEWRTASWSAGVSGFALARDASTVQRDVDPGAAARGFFGWGFRAFENDLAGDLRVEVEGVGARDVDDPTGGTLPGYVTSSAVASLSIADAHVVVRLNNLEGRQYEQVWLDARTGAPALGPGRAVVFALIWRLLN